MSDKTCNWNQVSSDDFSDWVTDCGFDRADQCDPIDFNFCPGCGSPIALVMIDEKPDPDRRAAELEAQAAAGIDLDEQVRELEQAILGGTPIY